MTSSAVDSGSKGSERSLEMKKLRRHVLGEGWTRFQLHDGNWECASKVWLVPDKENRGLQTPVELKLQKWDRKVRLVLEEIPSKDSTEAGE